MTLRKVGRYELIEEIGKGGMATVFRAFDPLFKRDVAVKVLDKGLLHEPSLKARFEREAQTIAALEHPAIVPVYDFGEEQGHLYLVMRLMLGGSLASRVAQGPLPLAEVLQILQRIGGALDRAHAKGVIHRDLKPGNIMFDEYGDAYLGDFGIARLTESTVTLTGDNIIGTPAYMSPEQIHGDKSLDSRSDIYALGVICFEMLTGQRPYTDSSPSRVMMRHVMDPIPDIRQVKPDLPPRVENIITHSMAKQPNDRFPTAAALTDTFAGVVQGAMTTDAQNATTVVEPVAVTTPVVEPGPEPTPMPVVVTPQTEVAVPSFIERDAPSGPARPRWLLPLLAGAGGLVVLIVIVAGIVYGINQMQAEPEATAVVAATSVPAVTAVPQIEPMTPIRPQTAPSGDELVDEFQSQFSENFASGSYLQALSVANEALEAMPEFAWWYHERASAQWALGLYDEAFASNVQGLELEPAHASLISQQARFLYEQGQTDEALQRHHEAIDLQPDNPYLLVDLALTYRDLGRLDDSIAALSRALELDPDGDGFYAERAWTFQLMGEFELALADLEAGLELNPANIWIYDQMAEIYFQHLGDLPAAEGLLLTAIDLEPAAWRYNTLANVVRQMGEVERALEYNNFAVELEPDVADSYAERAATYWPFMGQLDPALADMNHAVALAPNRADLLARRGQIYFHLGDFEAAEADFDRALRLDDGIPWAHVDRAILYRELGDLEAALADFARAIELEPDNPDTFLNRGYTFLWLGDQPLQALADFNAGLAINPDYAPLYLARAQVFANYLDQPVPALEDLDRCIETAPDYPWCYQDRASLHDRAGRIEAAVADFRRFLELVPPAECPECVQYAESYIEDHDG